MASFVASGPTGVTSFELIQQGERLTYFAFDLLELDGEDIARLPLVERKKQLAARWRPTRRGYGRRRRPRR
jgi:bifunctional non-homologous end joining protein LigD